jgi:hypothetical protein
MNEYRRVVQAGAAMLITLAVLLVALAAAVGQPDPLNSPAIAVAILDLHMEETGRRVVELPFEQGRIACADAAWNPAWHQAVRTLEADPAYTDTVTRWAEAWGQTLVFCYLGDMGKATITLDEVHELRDTMFTTTKKAKPNP